MMNRTKYLLILIYSFLALSCSIDLPRSINLTATPTNFLTNVLDTTSTPHVVTTTIPPTLLPKTAKETIQTLLQEPVDCLAPCMWGITPHTTNIEEAINKYMQFGMKLNFVSEKGSKKYYDTNYRLPSGLFILHMITADNGVITSIKMKNPRCKRTGYLSAKTQVAYKFDSRRRAAGYSTLDRNKHYPI